MKPSSLPKVLTRWKVPFRALYLSVSTVNTIKGRKQDGTQSNGIPEEEDGGPIVGEVFGWCARGACRFLSDIMGGRIHGGIEGVAADDLMQMHRRHHAGVDQARET